MTKRNGICDDRVVQAGLTMKNVQLDVGDDGGGKRPQNEDGGREGRGSAGVSE